MSRSYDIADTKDMRQYSSVKRFPVIDPPKSPFVKRTLSENRIDIWGIIGIKLADFNKIWTQNYLPNSRCKRGSIPLVIKITGK
jgi:hypothetical protein